MTRDDEKKNTAKHARNAWLASDNVIAIISPNTAPLLFTPFRFNPYTISNTGTSTENSHRVGGIPGFSVVNTEKKIEHHYLSL